MTVVEQLEKMAKDHQEFKATMLDVLKGSAFKPEALAPMIAQAVADLDRQKVDGFAERDVKIAKLEEELVSAKNDLAAAVSANDELKAKVVSAAAKIEEIEKSVERRANVKALAIETKRGVSAPISEDPNSTPNAPAKKELTGLARTRAHIREQIAGIRKD